KEPVDVVVTDMRMPGMDGAALLERVCLRSPRTVRIILSGMADKESTLRSVTVSHQFLSKPCDPKELVAVVERTCELQRILEADRLREVVGRVKSLPLLPATTAALMEALRREEPELDEIADIVTRDVGLAANVLKLANSSYFGARKEIADIHQATVYLGMFTIRDLVLSAEVFTTFEGLAVDRQLLMQEQQRAEQIAQLAREIAGEGDLGDNAFLAGMLHDVGVLVQASHLPADFERINDFIRSDDEHRSSVERDVLGVTHGEIGAYLLGVWGLPYEIVEAVAFHHEPSRVPNAERHEILTAVHVADAFVEGFAARAEGSAPALDHGYLARVGVTATELDRWQGLALRMLDPEEEAA
ncbi:MAG: response regulator, partial [Planctomycetota bacterium]